MKRFITLLAAMTISGICLFAQETEAEIVSGLEPAFTEEGTAESAPEKLRLDILVGDTIGTNFMSAANTTNLAMRLGIKENHIGFILGGMFREGFDVADLDYGFPLDFYWSANPYIGVELWNVEISGGIVFSPSSEKISPYAGVFYLFNVIKQKPGYSDRLAVKAGIEYFFDMFSGKYISDRRSESDSGVGSAFIDLFSIIVPKVSVGVQYSFGWGF